MDTKLKRSTTFHPQTKGHIEVVNRTMVHLLRGCCGKHPKLWDEHLHMRNIPTIEQCTHLCIVHHMRHVLVTCQKTLLIWSLEGKMAPMDVMIGTKLSSSFNESNWFTKQCKSSWRKVKPVTRLDMIKKESIINSKWAIRCGSTSAKTGWREKERSCG